MRFCLFDSCLQIRPIPLGRRNAPPMERGRAAERKNLFPSVCSCVWLAAALRCGLHQDSLALSPEDLLDRGLGNRSRRGAHCRPAAGRLDAARVRRRIERLLRRATQKRNSDGESISGMSGTDFHAIFSRERPSAFWPRLTRTNTHWRTWIFFGAHIPRAQGELTSPGEGYIHSCLTRAA